jgi:PEP-CTERM motif
MNVARVPVYGIALLALLAGAAAVRADPIQWSYNWSSSPGIVYSDNSQTSYITLTSGQILQSAAGDSDIVATNLRTFSNAPPATPATFTAKVYTLNLLLQDQQSGQSGTLTFSGQFDGTLSELSSNIQNTFTGPTTQTLFLGNNVYTATIGPYSPPGPTNSTNAGSISAFAQVTVSTIIIQDVPEPSSFLLVLLGTPLAGLALWRRRRAAS